MMRKILISLAMLTGISILHILIGVDLGEHYVWWRASVHNASFICLGWYLFDIWN